MGKAGQGSDADGFLFVIGNAPHRVDPVDAHQLRAGPFSLADLHQDITTAGQDLGLWMFHQKMDRFLDASRFIQSFDIIHSGTLPFVMEESGL